MQRLDCTTPAGLTLITKVTALRKLSISPDLSSARWAGDLGAKDPEQVRQSLIGSFQFVEDDPRSGHGGLRPPQLGALHSILGYWTTNTPVPATAVMPTGTGKTDTMLALFCAALIERLLVLVPSDALREQLAKKFESLGVLQEFGVVNRSSGHSAEVWPLW